MFRPSNGTRDYILPVALVEDGTDVMVVFNINDKMVTLIIMDNNSKFTNVTQTIHKIHNFILMSESVKDETNL